MLDGEPFKEIFTQPSLKTSQTAEVSHLKRSPIFLMRLPSSSWKCLSRSLRGGGLHSRTQATQTQKGRVLVLTGRAAPTACWVLPPHILGWLLHSQQEGAAPVLGLQLAEALHAFLLLLGRLAEKWPTAAEPHRHG